MHFKSLNVGLVVMGAFGLAAWSQAPAATPPAFDVVSVKVDMDSRGMIPPDLPVNGSWERARRRSVSVDDLGAALERTTGKPVVNLTGLNGLYDMTVTFAPGGTFEEAAAAIEPSPESLSNIDRAFTIQSGRHIDLGAPKDRTLPVIVVVHVAMPTPN